MRAVKNWDDDNEGNCIGKGKLRILGAFGDLPESIGIGSHNGNGGFGRLFRVQFASKKGWKLMTI
jgi:hypothetical protein